MIKQLHDKIQREKITVKELTKRCFQNIQKREKEIRAFLEIFKEDALRKAREIDQKVSRGEKIGLLEGIPVAIKDNILIKGKRATAGSKMLENFIAPYDATVIKILKKAGVIFVGKTNMDEFAMGSSTENSAFGPTRNPFDSERVPGGSSGGSAAAVAADMAIFSLGSDTGGSIRQPANFCGVVGLKPTYGRISRYGLIAMASSYDQIGPFAKSVEDAAIVLKEISLLDKNDNTSFGSEGLEFDLNGKIEGKKIGLVKNFFEDGLDQEVKEIILKAIKKAAQKGAEIVEIELPHLKYSLAVYYLMQTSEVSSNLARFDGIRYGFSKALEQGSSRGSLLDIYLGSRSQGFGPEVKRRIILGTYSLSAGYYDAYYKKAQKVREVIKKELKEAFQKVDVLISPVSPTLAFKLGERTENPLEMYLADIYTVSANVAMIPAISVPIGWLAKENSKLPIGLQIMGKWWDEKNVLEAADFFEKNSWFREGFEK